MAGSWGFAGLHPSNKALVLNPQRGCVCFVHFSLRKRRNRVAVEISFPTSCQGSRSGNPGLELANAFSVSEPRAAHHRLWAGHLSHFLDFTYDSPRSLSHVVLIR